MAAIDLELGRGWGQERPELMDNFDSEMQEWEDQLQDIQMKIEELYNEVQARRGANDIPSDNQKNGSPLEFRGDHMHHHLNGHGPPVSQQSGYGVSEIGDLLENYLGKGQTGSRRNNSSRHVHFSDTVKVKPDISARPENHRLWHVENLGALEESENRKNQTSHTKRPPCRESLSHNEHKVAKPPVGQRDVFSVQARAQIATPSGSPSLEKKPLSQGLFGDRKCSSPSVLRKFGAMLQENEGKLLTESGVVTQQGLVPEPKCPTPGCQRRALGGTGGASKAPVRVSNQKCPADPDLLTAEAEHGQDRAALSDSCRHGYKDQRGSQSANQQAQRRCQAQGSPKIRAGPNSGTERDGGRAQGEKARKTAFQQVEPKTEHRAPSASPRPHRIQRGQQALDCIRLRDEGLIELLDMLEIQHEYSSSPRTGLMAGRPEPHQAHTAEKSLAKPSKSFSRPARPANQRPPSRWAGRTPSTRITAPSGPIYRPPSPRTHTPSPRLKHRPPISYSLQTETVIM